MAMVTRCPSCDTLFRVTPQQLQAQHGQVRCGRCMAVFDGFGALATLPDQRPEEPPARVPAERDILPAGGLVPDASATAINDQLEPQALPEQPAAVSDAPAAESIHSIDQPSAPTWPAPSAATTALPEAASRDGVQSVTGEAGGEPGDGAAAQPAHRRGSRAWAFGAALMLVALVGQAGYRYRVELIAHYPVLKPVAARLCGLAGCSIPLPQRPQLITIEASDLQAQDQTRPGLIQLTATLRNQASYEVGYPALDLVLTNTKEHALARRIFMPEDYLEQGRSKSAGLPPNAETTVRLVLDTRDLGAAGFRLALLPAR
jgi:predicted Zn finger-like uncharacterized protein